MPPEKSKQLSPQCLKDGLDESKFI